MTSFSVYKIHSGSKKGNGSRASLNKKESMTSNEDKSLAKSNSKNAAMESAKKASRPKNVIRRETQDKLKQLWQLFCKVIEDKGECWETEENKKDGYQRNTDPKPDNYYFY